MRQQSKKLTFEYIKKDIPTGARVIDFYKVIETGFTVNIIITSRGIGKTYNFKDFAYNEYKTKGKKSMFIRNLERDIENERTNFLNETPEYMKGCYFTGSFKNNNVWLNTENGEPFMKLGSLNGAENEKASRVYYDYLCFDEINVSANYVRDYTAKFGSLLGSTENRNKYVNGKGDNFKIFMFGNNKSLNHIMLIRLGVFHIENEYTGYIDGDSNKLWAVWFEQSDLERRTQFKENNRHNTRFKIAEMIGMSEHNYFNDTLYSDDINLTYPYLDAILTDNSGDKDLFGKTLDLAYTFRFNGRYFALYNLFSHSPFGTYMHIIDLDSIQAWHRRLGQEFNAKDWMTKDENGKPWFVVMDGKPIDGGFPIPNDQKKKLILSMGKSEISFENVSSRVLFCQAISK